ncbi:uncharacterized protein PV09_09318 [Verruconis gallopava]|uniref:Cytokinesis regulator n=1 Tax=Verruconis gallopava TaxID=253628 RepID=A0A0D1ZWS9_9PEZI|nr:uncharacterized protein PV09_09318 [Verruconis gallopava]KIV98932.1 hypothetical protein PV09_09318 [Verruconis gallopava]
MAPEIENWDDDADFQGDINFGTSTGAHSTGFSSRRSVSARSESNAADEDWHVLITPSDDEATSKAIASAKQVGIPIPQNVPPSALLGGAIKRLGKQRTPAKRNVADDWGDDFDLGGSHEVGLKLKVGLGKEGPVTPAANTNAACIDDDFDSEWAEGSLGIRFGGTRRDTRGRSSSVSAMSPSMGSCTSMTGESEDDELGGLVFPDEPLDFKARLEQRKQQDSDFEDRFDPPLNVPAKRIRPGEDDDDMLSGLELGGVDIIEHSKKRNLNRNVKIELPKTRTSSSRSSVTTITFTDKSSTSRIPRPTSTASKHSQLAPVYETGNGQSSQSTKQPYLQRTSRPAPTTTSAQLLRQKRSAPVLGRPTAGLSNRQSVPFLPAGAASGQSHNVNARISHQRQVSDHHERPMSPPARSFSRMSVAEQQRATPSRTSQRRDAHIAPPHLARVAVSNQRLRVQIKREYGKGDELDAFDDLPTSAAKESKFMKEPKAYGPATLRRKDSRTNLKMQMPERSATATPGSATTPASSTVPSTPGAPATPKSYFVPRQDNTPRFARDTAASRNAREQRLSQLSTASQPSLRRTDGPVMPSHINWKAQVAARSPHNSPTATRKKSSKDIKKNFIPLSMAPPVKNEKGMVYNAAKQRWEGNENMVYNFPDNPSTSTLPLQPTHGINHSHHHHTNSIPSSIALGHREPNTLPRHGSPPRPALIANVNQNRGPRIERGMVFDPEKHKWLKVDPRQLDRHDKPLTPGSVSIEEDDDPFAGIEDLPDERSKITPGMGGINKENNVMDDDWNLGEEFDLGQRFIKRQRIEEVEWRKWTEKWFINGEARPNDGDSWKWEIRRVAERYQNEGFS